MNNEEMNYKLGQIMGLSQEELRHRLIEAMGRIDFLMTHDMQLQMNNVRYGTSIITHLVETKEIKDYNVCFFNIRNMAGINAIAGRDAGTAVMKDFVGGIEFFLSGRETIFRMGGDNFTVIIKKEKTEQFIKMIKGTKIKVPGPADETVIVSAVAGIYECDERTTLDDAMDNSLETMNLAKFSRHVSHLFYNKEIASIIMNIKRVENVFPEALNNGEFTAFYQPKVNIDNNKLTGAEALCRWVRPDGVLPPGAFISVLERSKRICKLDMYMLEKVCKDLRTWLDEGIPAVPVSTNFSRMNLKTPDIVPSIISVIDKYQIPHELISIEVTETKEDEEFQRLKEFVNELLSYGIKVSVDDFGTGYSSMTTIRDIHFSEMKIDRSFFLYNDETEDRNLVMVRHVIKMAEELSMSCIAEGAETIEHIALLKSMGCRFVQGFFFDRPLPENEFRKRLNEPYYK